MLVDKQAYAVVAIQTREQGFTYTSRAVAIAKGRLSEAAAIVKSRGTTNIVAQLWRAREINIPVSLFALSSVCAAAHRPNPTGN